MEDRQVLKSLMRVVDKVRELQKKALVSVEDGRNRKRLEMMSYSIAANRAMDSNSPVKGILHDQIGKLDDELRILNLHLDAKDETSTLTHQRLLKMIDCQDAKMQRLREEKRQTEEKLHRLNDVFDLERHEIYGEVKRISELHEKQRLCLTKEIDYLKAQVNECSSEHQKRLYSPRDDLIQRILDLEHRRHCMHCH